MTKMGKISLKIHNLPRFLGKFFYQAGLFSDLFPCFWDFAYLCPPGGEASGRNIYRCLQGKIQDKTGWGVHCEKGLFLQVSHLVKIGCQSDNHYLLVQNGKGKAGGIWGQNFNFLHFFIIQKIQNMPLQNLFTEMKKLNLVLRCGVSKFGPILRKISKCMVKYKVPPPRPYPVLARPSWSDAEGRGRTRNLKMVLQHDYK